MDTSNAASKARSFDLAKDYSQLLSGAHRKPATPIGAPSLMAQFSFWQPGEGPGHSARDPNGGGARPSWGLRTDEYIRALHQLIKDDGFNTPNTERGEITDARYIFLFANAIDLHSTSFSLVTPDAVSRRDDIDEYFNTRNQSVLLTFKWHYLQTIIRIEKHQEYLTLTVILDLSVQPATANHDGATPIPPDELLQDPICGPMASRFKDFAADLVEYKEELQASEAHQREINTDQWRNRFLVHHDDLYRTIWDKFLNSILLSRTPMPQLGLHTTDEGTFVATTVDQCRQALGDVFADFRAIVLAPPHRGQDSTIAADPIQMPWWRKPDITQENFLGKKLGNRGGQRIMRELWPFVTSEKLVPLRRKEFTASRMLGGHALYISALGAQPSPYVGEAPARKTEQVPVYYLMYVTTYSQWQIGRLIDRINHLGTVRIAAIQELKTLVETSVALRKLRVPADAAGIHDAQRVISTWDATFGDGLNYRIERSRYYVKEFTDGLTQLRIRRVEGYQPYNLFVLRRLASTFDFVDRLGIRLDRFRNSLDTSAQSISANALVELQRIQSEVLGKSIEYTKTLNTNTALLVELQRSAELALFCALCPYYVIATIDHFRELAAVEPAAPGAEHHPATVTASHIFMAIYAVIWIAFFTFGIFRARHLSRTKKPRQARTEFSGNGSWLNRVVALPGPRAGPQPAQDRLRVASAPPQRESEDA